MIIIGSISSLNVRHRDQHWMNKNETLSDVNVGEQRLLGASANFGVYIGGSVGGVVFLIIVLVLIYFFCCRRARV